MAGDPSLKPCPFCGGRAIFEAASHGSMATWTIGCGNEAEDCIATMMITTYNRKVEAAEAWNKRI